MNLSSTASVATPKITPYVGLMERLNDVLHAIDNKTQTFQSGTAEAAVKTPNIYSEFEAALHQVVEYAEGINNRLQF